MIRTAGAGYPAPSDDTIELLYQVRQANASVTLDAGRTYRVRTVGFAAGVTLTIPATTVVEVIDNGLAAGRSLTIADVAGVTITGAGTIRGTSSARTSVYGLIRAERSNNLIVEGITLHTSPGQAIFVYGGSGGRFRNLTVHTTGADGIQLTRGATSFEVVDNTIYNTGDDGIGVISYLATGQVNHDACSAGLVARNTITNVTVGRGIAGSGIQQVTIEDNTINGCDQAGILVAGDGAAHRSADVIVQDNHIRDTGRDIPEFGTGDGCYVTQCDVAQLNRLNIDQCGAGTRYGILAIDSTSTSINVGTGHTFGATMLDTISHG